MFIIFNFVVQLVKDVRMPSGQISMVITERQNTHKPSITGGGRLIMS